MPKVTSVEPQKKNPYRYNIFLDGQFAFGADEDTVVNFRLVVGKQIDPKDLEAILFETQIGKLMERMYNLFSIRIRSEKEIRNYLRNLSFKRKTKDQEEVSELVRETVINKLKQKNLIDDFEFAKTWVNSRGKKKGASALKAELFKKGISKEIIDAALNDILPEDQATVATHLIEKRLTRWKSLTAFDKKRKALEFLVRHGFSYEVAKQVTQQLISSDSFDNDL